MNNEKDASEVKPDHNPESTTGNGDGEVVSSHGASEASDSATSEPAGKILDDLSRRNTASNGRGKIRRKRANPLLLVVLILPLFAAAVFLANQQYLLQSIVGDLRQANSQLSGQVATQTNRLAEQSARLDQIQNQLSAPNPVDMTPLRQTEAELNRQIDFLRQQLGELETRQRTASAQPDFDWKLQEADFLLRQADAQLELGNDSEAAINLMQMADAALVASGQTGVAPVREALAGDMAELRSAEPLDQEGLYLRLNRLGESLTEVDLLQSMREYFLGQREQNSEPGQLDGEDSWLGSGLNFLSEVFVWREWDEQPQAMLASGQQSVVKQNLRLLVKQAQIAVLDPDGQLYRQSLGEIEALLGRYAVTDSTQGQGIMAELESLRGIEVDQPQPSLRATLNAMQQLLASNR